MATRNGIVGREVYDKKRGLMGRVVKEDGLQITLEFNDGNEKTVKAVTPTVFKRWYRLLDEEPQEESAEDVNETETSEDEDKLAPKKRANTSMKFPAGAPGVGAQLVEYFRFEVGEYANQDLEYKVSKDGRIVIVKYNGRNVFEITVCKRRINVLCHKKSLSADNLSRATKVYPDNFGWPLSVQYTFTELTDTTKALIRCIITDGLYYRQVIEKAED